VVAPYPQFALWATNIASAPPTPKNDQFENRDEPDETDEKGALELLRPDLTNEGQLILNLRETVTVGGIDRTKAENRKRLLRRLDACDQFFET